MTSVVADTHTLIWYIFDLNKFSEASLNALEQATNSGNPIYVSAISVVEIAYLVEKGRLPEDVFTRVLNALDDPKIGLVLAPLDRNISGKIGLVDRATVADMPDRIIAATALHLGFPLVTRDTKVQNLSIIKTIW